MLRFQDLFTRVRANVVESNVLLFHSVSLTLLDAAELVRQLEARLGISGGLPLKRNAAFAARMNDRSVSDYNCDTQMNLFVLCDTSFGRFGSLYNTECLDYATQASWPTWI